MSLKPLLPAFAWLVAVTYLSVNPGIQFPKFDLFSIDKLLHAGAYALLAWLLAWGVSKSKKGEFGWGAISLVFCFSTLYGALMEWVQGAYFPGRFFEWDDMLANAAGASLAMIFFRRYFRIA